jgi:predicted regulator of Ras-like GTPase activity (Roadblock/LC7/MglB family)
MADAIFVLASGTVEWKRYEGGQGTLRETVARSSGGYVVVYAIGASAVLILIGGEGLDIARLPRESRATVESIEKLPG